MQRGFDHSYTIDIYFPSSTPLIFCGDLLQEETWVLPGCLMPSGPAMSMPRESRYRVIMKKSIGCVERWMSQGPEIRRAGGQV